MDKRKIIIFDTTLRDGEQSPGASLTVNEKLVIAHQLARLGVDVIEAGFPIASEGDFEAVKVIARNVKGPTIAGLARANDADIDRCWEAVKYAEKPRIHTFIATSKVHRDEKLRKTKEEVIDLAVKAVKRAKSYCDDVEFSPEDAARTSPDYMCDVVRAVIAAGATTVNIPDTVGYSEPQEFGDRIRYLFEQVPEAKNIVVSVHCHNDLGNAVANSLAAVEAGAGQVEGCINGIGERAGNASLEEVVMNLTTRKDFYNVALNINTREIYKTSRLVSNLTGIEVQRNKAIVGVNAFAHEAGIHQHGVLKSKATYEIMTPEEVGWMGENLVIGKHSGKHAVTALLQDEGFQLDKDQIQQITEKVKDLADKQKSVEREDVIAIARDITHQLSEEEQFVKLEEFAVITGSDMTPTASVKLRVNGELKIAAGVGDGPVDAISNAIWQMVDPSLKLMDYHLKAITGGTDALADVSIKLSDEKQNIFVARSVDEDVIRASAKAIVKGINKALSFREKIHPQR
ncbi:MAG TPA: 2-isopropylmalate synthase [Candidatus Marinimicrobia bacterium]|nr:2-isopropylmalate synthase [Candidatus Neomarinimicrobiota bacterium]